MGVEPADLKPRWLAVDAGATRIRVAPVCVGSGPVLGGEVEQAEFSSPEGPARVEQAAHLLQRVAHRQGWDSPYQVALAWAGAPTSDGHGIAYARYGPSIPDLVERLREYVPLAHAPCLQSDARAALEGAVLEFGLESAYALISGSGLGEAYYSRGQSWTREEFQDKLGRAADWMHEGRDGESWLRAEAWRDSPDGMPFREVLRALLAHRRKQIQPQAVLLDGHFSKWFERGWVPTMDFPILAIPPHSALPGCVQMELRRLTSTF